MSYEKSPTQYIDFTQRNNLSDAGMMVDKKDESIEDIKIGRFDATLSDIRIVTWNNGEYNFSIYSTLEVDEITKFALELEKTSKFAGGSGGVIDENHQADSNSGTIGRSIGGEGGTIG